MARVEFTAFVEDVKGDWLLKTAEPHRKQSAEGKWETVGRTFRTVKPAYGTSQDYSSYSKGDRIEVVGTEVTESREYQGKRFFDLVVKAESVKLVLASPVQNTFPIGSSDSQPAVDDSLPF